MIMMKTKPAAMKKFPSLISNPETAHATSTRQQNIKFTKLTSAKRLYENVSRTPHSQFHE